ncbi:MAG: helix-turn-helix domain-containing protein [Eubacterium sp.]|nr:helix-turn-helix domain-containing protein [Eubacterium sp.]
MVMALYDSGMKIADIVRNTELSRSTVNRIIKNHSSSMNMIQSYKGVNGFDILFVCDKQYY